MNLSRTFDGLKSVAQQVQDQLVQFGSVRVDGRNQRCFNRYIYPVLALRSNQGEGVVDNCFEVDADLARLVDAGEDL